MGVPEGEGLADEEGDPEGEGLADGEGESEGEGLADGEGESEGESEGDGPADEVGESEGDGLVGEGSGDGPGEVVAVGDGEGVVESAGGMTFSLSVLPVTWSRAQDSGHSTHSLTYRTVVEASQVRQARAHAKNGPSPAAGEGADHRDQPL